MIQSGMSVFTETVNEKSVESKKLIEREKEASIEACARLTKTLGLKPVEDYILTALQDALPIRFSQRTESQQNSDPLGFNSNVAIIYDRSIELLKGLHKSPLETISTIQFSFGSRTKIGINPTASAFFDITLTDKVNGEKTLHQLVHPGTTSEGNVLLEAEKLLVAWLPNATGVKQEDFETIAKKAPAETS